MNTNKQIGQHKGHSHLKFVHHCYCNLYEILIEVIAPFKLHVAMTSLSVLWKLRQIDHSNLRESQKHATINVILYRFYSLVHEENKFCGIDLKMQIVQQKTIQHMQL